SPSLFWCWLILLGVFVVDATFTLLRRLLRGDKIHQSHRSHAYQHAARMLSRHLPVTLGVVAINLFWLLPLALLVVLGIIDGVLGMLIAYAPLIWLVVRLGAGKP
ncbi:glycosyl transferase, partial [Pseudomonas aeruginosa]